MKKLRKLTSLLLAAVLMLSMSIAVLAVHPVTASAADTGSITITEATVDKEYSIYKILDLTYDSTNESYAYTVNSAWAGFFDESNTNYNGALNYVTIDANGYVTWKDSASAQAFGQLAAKFAESAGISATTTITADSTTVTFQNLELGYYLVTTTVGSLVELNTVTATSVEVVDKNAKPVLTKEVANEEDAEAGDYGFTSTAGFTDTVYYKITITGIDEIDSLTLHDTLPNGFDVSTLKITSVWLYTDSDDTDPAELKTATGTGNDDYTVNTPGTETSGDECSFEISFDSLLQDDPNGSYASKVTSDEAFIVIYYTVTATDGSTVGSSGNVNTAWLTFSGDNTSAEKTTTTYIYDFYVYKYTGNSTALSGAVFTLTNEDGEYATFDSNGNLTDWVSVLVDECYLTTDTDGFIHLNGLDAGTYYLTETTAPDGYALLSSSVTVTVSDTGGVTGAEYNTIKSNEYVVKVKNETSSAMPTTGGIGTTIFYIVGCILVLGAVVLLVTRRRMNNTAK